MNEPKLFPDQKPITQADRIELEKMGLLVPEKSQYTGQREGQEQTNKSAGQVISYRPFYKALQTAKVTQEVARKLLVIEANRPEGPRNTHVLKLSALSFFDEKMNTIRKVENYGKKIAGKGY